MQNPEFILENETHKIFWELEIETDRLISARQLDLVLVNKKKKLPNNGLDRPIWPQS